MDGVALGVATGVLKCAMHLESLFRKVKERKHKRYFKRFKCISVEIQKFI